MLERLVTISSVLGGSMIQGSKLAGEGDEPFTSYVLQSIVFLRYGSFKKSHAVEGGSRLGAEGMNGDHAGEGGSRF